MDRNEYPSFIISDEEDIQVEKIEKINDHWMLYLSDTTIEFLEWKNIEFSNLAIDSVWIKNKLKKAAFSRSASEKINEMCMELLADKVNWEENITDEQLKSLLLSSSAKKNETIDLTQEFDVVVVGSATNGAAAAKVLTEKGNSVLVIESGKPHDEDNFKTMNHFIRHGEYWDFAPWK